MDNQVFVTVLSGVSVFVIGQIVLKLFIEPIISLKSTFGEISGLFLREQPDIIGARANEEIREEIFRFSSLLLAKKSAVPFYPVVRFFFGLPSSESLTSAAKSLNRVGALTVCTEGDTDRKIKHQQILESMENISKRLKIVTDYAAL
ncbi:hypothetical protein G6Z94_17910 [Vibrio aestuarianus]|uniref:hypothetical protein n=1 Tax=Vibrio aestuarianus TaxID=28171 RepID=UPI001593EC48|nr:hypothetical protein [Vibrio aestuarianus]NGZ19171.1 hypothetical protein [Vibrio aestuarianus]